MADRAADQAAPRAAPLWVLLLPCLALRVSGRYSPISGLASLERLVSFSAQSGFSRNCSSIDAPLESSGFSVSLATLSHGGITDFCAKLDRLHCGLGGVSFSLTLRAMEPRRGWKGEGHDATQTTQP